MTIWMLNLCLGCRFKPRSRTGRPAHRYRSNRSTARQRSRCPQCLADGVPVDTFGRCSPLALPLQAALFQPGLQRIRGDMPSAVLDDPDSLRNELTSSEASAAFVEVGTFAWTRLSHSIFVVKSLPAIRSTISRHRTASRRKPKAVIVPSGKANFAANERRIGAVGATGAEIKIVS